MSNFGARLHLLVSDYGWRTKANNVSCLHAHKNNMTHRRGRTLTLRLGRGEAGTLPFLPRQRPSISPGKLPDKALLKEPLLGGVLRPPSPPSDSVTLSARSAAATAAAAAAVSELPASSGAVTPRIAAAFRLMVRSAGGEVCVEGDAASAEVSRVSGTCCWPLLVSWWLSAACCCCSAVEESGGFGSFCSVAGTAAAAAATAEAATNGSVDGTGRDE